MIFEHYALTMRSLSNNMDIMTYTMQGTTMIAHVEHKLSTIDGHNFYNIRLIKI